MQISPMPKEWDLYQKYETFDMTQTVMINNGKH